jgi:Protein of unknown function (DUF2911)
MNSFISKLGQKLAFFGIFIALVGCSMVANAQELPQASPMSRLEQRIGLTDIVIKYSRPSVKGRKLWGDLIPYNQVWRSGANSATLIAFTDNVVINGQTLPAGEYSFYTIPTETEWTIIFNKNIKLWGSDGYKAEEDALRFKVTPDMNAPNTETMHFVFDNITTNSGQLHFKWEKLNLSMSIGVDTDTKALANIKRSIGDVENAYRTYNASATYLLDANKEPQQALDWAKKSVNSQEKFWNLQTLSRALATNGLYKEAVLAAEKSLKLSTEAKNDAYIQMNKKNIEEWKKKK